MAEYKDVEQMKKQIADFKRAVNAVEPMNSDYLTGYISALSVVEGEIAEQPAADVAPVRHGEWANEETAVFTPTWGCGLKLKSPVVLYSKLSSPRLGVWISFMGGFSAESIQFILHICMLFCV